MQYGRLSILQPLSVLIDLFCLNLAFVGAYFLRYHQIEGCFSSPNLVIFWVFNITWALTLLALRPSIEPRMTFNFYKLTYNFLILLILHACLIAVFCVSIQAYYFSRLHLLFTYIILFTCGISIRALGVLFLKQLRTSGFNLRKYIIVGYGELSPSIVKFYNKHPEMGYQFFGYFDEKYGSDENDIKGDFQVLRKFIVENEIDYIYCCLSYIDNKKLQEIIDHSELHRSQVKLLVDFTGFMKRGVSIEYHDHLPIINLSEKPFSDFRTAIVKRSFDIIFSLIALILGSPLLIILASITKLTSKGPALYSQERIGLFGKPFKIYKFRSMYLDSEKNGPALSNGRSDSRITPWGQIMRKTRLDELPQFWNVLIGDMSVVGPRPERKHFIDQIVQIAPEFINLQQTKPGITSIGQIKYGYASGINEMVERMNYDLKYNPSFRQDMALIFQTVLVMALGKGK